MRGAAPTVFLDERAQTRCAIPATTRMSSQCSQGAIIRGAGSGNERAARADHHGLTSARRGNTSRCGRSRMARLTLASTDAARILHDGAAHSADSGLTA